MAEHKVQECAWVGCSKPPRAALETRSLCLEHFLELSQRRLDLIERELEHEPGNRHFPPGTQNLLPEMVSQMSLLAVGTKLLHPVAREQLISLSATASALHKKLLRPPRFDRHVECLVQFGAIPSDLAETCFTMNISQRGACVETERPLAVKQVITLEQPDTGRRTKAKVIWIHEMAGTTYAVGLELLDPEDFWGLA